MLPRLREAASRALARAVGSRFAKPIARLVLAAAGLCLLAVIGKTAVAGAMSSSIAAPSPPASTMNASLASSTAPSPPPTPSPTAPSPASSVAEPSPSPSPAARPQAAPDDPVILNTATPDDLRRLPGVGEKRATAIVALRTRMGGRFHAIEDLLKVKGIGRATLRRLRPLVRLDPFPSAPDAGS